MASVDDKVVQEYLKSLLDKYNSNPENPDLSEVERVLITQIRSVQIEISGLISQIEELNKGIRENQEKGNGLVQQLVSKQGENQGYINALLKLKK